MGYFRAESEAKATHPWKVYVKSLYFGNLLWSEHGTEKSARQEVTAIRDGRRKIGAERKLVVKEVKA